MTIETLSEQKAFGGTQGVYKHASAITKTQMEFSVFMPPNADAGPVPVLYYLSGLTCSQENVTTKGGFQRYAAEHGIAVVCPEKSNVLISQDTKTY